MPVGMKYHSRKVYLFKIKTICQLVKLPVVSNVTGYVDEQQVEELDKDALEVSFDDKEGEGELEFFFFDDKELEEEGRG